MFYTLNQFSRRWRCPCLGHSQSQTFSKRPSRCLILSLGCEKSVLSLSLLQRHCLVGFRYVTGLNIYQFFAIEDNSSVSDLGPSTARYLICFSLQNSYSLFRNQESGLWNVILPGFPSKYIIEPRFKLLSHWLYTHRLTIPLCGLSLTELLNFPFVPHPGIPFRGNKCICLKAVVNLLKL